MKSESDSNGVEFMQKDQEKETTGSCSKGNVENNHNNEVLNFSSPNNGQSADPTSVEPPQTQTTSDDDVKAELESAPAGDDQPQPDQTKTNSLDSSRSEHVSNDNSDVVSDDTAAQQTIPCRPSYSNHKGSGLQAELRREESVNKGKEILSADELEKINNGNNHLNENQPALHYPNLFPQNPSGIRFMNGESTQSNQQQQAPTCFSNKENDLYRHLAPGLQANQVKATNVSDPFCYNFILPTSSRPQQLTNMLNASGSQHQSSDLTKHSLPMEPMTQQFSYHHSQVPWGPGSYNAHTFSTMFHETSSMPPSSVQLSAHDSQASNHFSMIPSLPNQDHHASELPENPLMSRLYQGLLTQTTKPNAMHPSPEATISSLFLNSPSLLQETVGSSAHHRTEPITSSNREHVTSGRRGHARSRFEQGETSSFKRFRRDIIMPQASIDEQVNNNPISLLNDAGSNSNNASLVRNPRPILNSVYDPMFEGLGLPIDPHLRLFAKYMG